MTKRRLLITLLTSLAALPLAADVGIAGTRQLDFLAGYLSLTEAQKTQATAIFTAAETARQTPLGQLTAAREALNTAVKANRPDAELDRLALAVGAIDGQLLGIGAKANAKFYALLTAEQKTKYDARSSQGPGGGRGGR